LTSDIKRCIKCQNTQPVFNKPGETQGLYCYDCKEDDMIDVKNKKCSKCTTRASYGFPLNSPMFCYSHREDGMILNPTKRCIVENCREKAEYGIRTHVHCFKHKEEKEISLVERECVRCKRIDVVNADQVCINFCLKSNEEFDIYKKRQKHKENRVLEILRKEIGEPTRIDNIIPSECGKETESRPDIVYDCKTHVVIIECDEFAHRGECKKGEDNRMKNVYYSFEGSNVVFVRYNPDNYKHINGKRAKDSQVVKEETLINWVKYLMKTEPQEILSVLYLFYDGYEKTDTPIYIDPYEEKLYMCRDCNLEFYIEDVYKVHNKKYHNV
jgi:hypothetical protein